MGGSLRSVQYTIQATEYHDSRGKKLDPRARGRAWAARSSIFIFPFFFLFFFIAFSCFLVDNEARVASSTGSYIRPEGSHENYARVEQIPESAGKK